MQHRNHNLRRLILSLIIFLSVEALAEERAGGSSRVDFGFRCTFDAELDGIHVILVHPGRSAERLGFLPDDVIKKINGNKLQFDNDLEMIKYLGEFKVGDRIRFQVLRGSEILDLEMVGEPMSETSRRNLERWMEAAEQRLSAGHGLYCGHCVDAAESTSEPNMPPGAISESWSHVLSGVDDRAEVRITKNDSGSVEIHSEPDGLLPEQFNFVDLGPMFANLTKALEPGDWFAIEIKRNEDKSILVTPTGLPPYLKKLLHKEYIEETERP